ncbi:MAG: GNAT family N-acetyltransferase [Verrucomicrobiota bacterium]
MDIRTMTIEDYDAVIRLLTATSGVRLRDADSREATSRYLERNPGLSFVAFVGGFIAGCVMCGHDGRRGYLQHLAVSETHRRLGIGSALVEACLTKLESLGIRKSHIDVLVENQQAHDFWRHRGWQKRDDIFRYSFVRSYDTNA